MRVHHRFICTATMLALLSGAGAIGSHAQTPRADQQMAQLDRSKPAIPQGATWRIVRIDGKRIAGRPSTLVFNANGNFGGKTCNSYGGSYKVDGRALTLSQVVSTMMACPEPQGAQERALFAAFPKVSGWRLTRRGLLELTGANGAVLIAARRG